MDSNLRQPDFSPGSSPRRVVHPFQAPAAVREDVSKMLASFALNDGSCDPVENDQALLTVLPDLNNMTVVRCDEVQWRFMGLSFAGWNFVISLIAALIAFRGARRLLQP